MGRLERVHHRNPPFAGSHLSLEIEVGFRGFHEAVIMEIQPEHEMEAGFKDGCVSF